MIKNLIIAGLSIAVVLCWVKVEPECANPDDPNTVVIEYECAILDEYDNVPPEVVEECRQRKAEVNKRTQTTT